MAGRAGAARHHRHRPATGSAASRRRNCLEQCGFGRRLDRDLLAADHRKRHSFWRARRCARRLNPPLEAMTDTADRTNAKDMLDRRIDAAAAALRAAQRADGHGVFELEVDVTQRAEYVLLTHYLGEQADLELERKIAVYLRSRQQPDGGWPLFHNGAFDISASMKAYFALKMIGD